MIDKRKEKGKKGEELAVTALEKERYRILERNYRFQEGEIDIIAEKDGTVYFVEVRSKSNLSYGTAAESITKIKRQKIAKTAEKYLADHDIKKFCGFLLISVDLNNETTEMIADMLV